MSPRSFLPEVDIKEKYRSGFQSQNFMRGGLWSDDHSIKSEPLKRVRNYKDKTGERWERESGRSVRSTKSEAFTRQKTHSNKKNEVLRFEDDLMCQLMKVRRKIDEEMWHTKQLIAQGRVDMLCQKIRLIGKLQKDREAPVVQLYKFLEEKQATELAASVTAEDSEIGETIARAVEATEVERAERRSQRSVASKSSRRSKMSRRSNRDQISVKSGMSGFPANKARHVEGQGRLNEKNQYTSQREALTESFVRRKRELKDQKDICKELVHSRGRITSGEDIKKLEDSNKTMVDVGYRLRVQLPSIEADEIDLELTIEDNEVFEVKKEMIKRMTGGKDNQKITSIQVSDSKKKVSEVLNVVRQAADKDKLMSEMTTVKTRLENQKELMKDILIT